MKTLLAITALLATASAAQAGDFVCVGTGRFAAIDKKPVALTQDSKEDRKKLIETASGEVQVSLEKADEAGGPYLMIDVVDMDAAGAISYHGAKGLVTGPVMYIDNPEALVKCAPVVVKTAEAATANKEATADSNTNLQ